MSKHAQIDQLSAPLAFAYHNACITRSLALSVDGFTFIKHAGIRHLYNVSSTFPSDIDITQSKLHNVTLHHHPICADRIIDEGVTIIMSRLCKLIDLLMQHTHADSRAHVYGTSYTDIGLICACLRRAQEWSVASAIREYCHVSGLAQRAISSIDEALFELIGAYDVTMMHRLRNAVFDNVT